MDNITEIISFVIKGGTLIIIALYLVFSALVLLNVRSLNRFVSITYYNLSAVLQLLYVIHILLVLSLFFLALVIL